MNTPSAKISVLAEDKSACVKIAGRANFTSSIDFKALLNQLLQRGCSQLSLELSECLLMDSTFLGVLAGFALRLNSNTNGDAPRKIELLNPSPRILELLDTIGVLNLFEIVHGKPRKACETVTEPAGENRPTQEQLTQNCLEAHRTLMSLSPENASRFKEVTQFLAEDLKKQKASS